MEVQQLPADAREFLAGSSRRMHGSFSPAGSSQLICTRSARGEAAAPLPPPAGPRGRGPVLACSIHTSPGRGRLAELLLRWFCPPVPTPTPLIPLPFSLPWDSESFRLKTFLFHGEKQGTKPKLCSPFSTSMVKRGRICPFYLQKRNFKVRLPSDSSTQYIFQTGRQSGFSQSCMLRCGAMDLFFFAIITHLEA